MIEQISEIAKVGIAVGFWVLFLIRMARMAFKKD